MARGSSYGEKPTIPLEPKVIIPRRATRVLKTVNVEDEELPRAKKKPSAATRELKAVNIEEEHEASIVRVVDAAPTNAGRPVITINDRPFRQLNSLQSSWIICIIIVILSLFVLISAGIFQRNGMPQVVNTNGLQSFSVQVGGSVDVISTWQNTNGPITPSRPIPVNPGPYSVLGKPTLSADFINQVLASYNSPAAGQGQALYDYGVKYGIDPAFALAFFMHESSFGTAGVAQTTLSLGNMRCIPSVPCYNYNGGYAQFSSWQQGFEAWYKLIRNLYIAQWGLITVDQIIPRYAPTSDNNNEAAYIASLKHAIDTWHTGIIRVS